MAKKLKNLKIRKVDFVEEGANPDAHTRLTKKKDGGQPAGDGGGNGRGVLHRLFSFIGKAAGMDQDEIDSAMEEIQKGSSMSFMERVNAVNTGKIADEIWDLCYALQSSFCSILNDEDLGSTDAATAMQESLKEFYDVVGEAIEKWSRGKKTSIVKKNEEVSEAELEVMKSALERLNTAIEKVGKGSGTKKSPGGIRPDDKEKAEGDEKEMKIDKSKLTDAEKAFLESIEKRYGTEENTPGNGGMPPAQTPAGYVSVLGAMGTGGQASVNPAPAEPVVAKSLAQPAAVPVQPSQEDEADSIYKGLHPAVRAELEGLKKFREDAEAREIAEVAKKYEIIGKKEEELVPLFKSLMAAGGTAYNDMIALLDQAVATVEKSGAFTEIGKSGHGSGAAGAAEAKIEVIAKGYMEKDSSLDYASAMAKAWEQNPELMAEYEAEEGF